MKKLMIAAAVAAIGMGAIAALESANVVGYYDVDSPAGDAMRCPTFKIVGGAGYDLTKIKVTGGFGMGDVNAQTISSAGLWVGQYYWFTEEGSGFPTGWYKDAGAGEPVLEGEVILDAGQAFYIHSDYEDLTLQVSGEVPKGDIDLSFSVGDGMLGNALPVDADLTDITVTGGFGMGDVNAQSISAGGVWIGQYYWFTLDGSGFPTGWYKDAGAGEVVEVGDVVLAPGESLYIHSDYEDLTFTLPAALAD